MKSLKAAICQIQPVRDKAQNIQHAVKLIEEAAGNGAMLVTMPEIFFYPYELLSLRDIADTDNSTIETLQTVAKKCGIYLCTGSIAAKSDKGIYNSSCLLSPDGEILLQYNKSHLFDVNFEKLHVKESDVFIRGDGVRVVETELGIICIIICYDVRFPEYVRTATMKGAEIIIIPAAFNEITGPAHWHIIMRARAIENQVYIMAASQAFLNDSTYKAYGHSMIINPWGTILAEAEEKEENIYARLDSDILEKTRKQLPLLKHRRPDLYQL